MAASARATTPHVNDDGNERQQPAQSQAPSQTPAAAAPPAHHPVKVWTNEELVAHRSPMDVYIFEKEAHAVATENAAFNEMMSCFMPSNAEGNADETQKEIDKTQQEISDREDAVLQAKRALREAPAGARLRNQMELAQRTAELNHAREKLWKLQEHLKDMQGGADQKSQANPGEAAPAARPAQPEQSQPPAATQPTGVAPPSAPN
jgi:hypothetical protein